MNKDIVVAMIGAAGAVLAAAVPLLIQNIRLRRRLQDAPTVARGLAVGYFHNFLRPISQLLGNAALEVKFDSKEQRIKSQAQFSSKQVELVLIIPKRLSAASINHATDEARLSQQAEILRPGSNRGFTVNYDLLERGGQKILVIRDVVKPYFAIKYYAEDYLKMDQDSEPWRELEIETLAEFRRTIERLRMKAEGVGINQISWKEIE